MPNPALLVCDSDVLVQFFLANEIRPFRTLRDIYGIQPTIVQEVDLELRWLGKHKDRFVHQLDKALKADVFRVLDPSYFQSFLSAAPVGASWPSFQSLGAQYEGRIHRGEAFTFAAAVTLGVPALSNDFSAIKTLEANFLTLPAPVLRGFDLLALSHQSGHLGLRDCEVFRSELSRQGEGMPQAFMNASFEDGLKNFSPRLREGVAGAATAVATYSATLHIAKI
jgi:hypothetical protein